MRDPATIREDYESPPLDEGTMADDPVSEFRAWFDAADAAGIPQVNAMVLSTVSAELGGAGRAVLLKGVDARGFDLYTNLHSRKAREIATHPRVALTFLWIPVHRQVRVEGMAEPIPADEADAYWATRPRGAQLGAWASPQSEVIADRAWLERRYAEVRERFGDGPVPRPDWWGGYRVVHDVVEFWQGRRDRLHDRVRYRRVGDGWTKERLAP